MRAIGERACKRYFTTGERFDASEARRLGLVSEVAAAEELDTALEALLKQLLGNGPEAVRAAKALAGEVAQRPLDPKLVEDTCERIARIRVSEEGQEGLTAFLDKRKPAWQDTQQ